MSELIDNTINGECSGCGQCCTNILTLSDKEIHRIKSYIGQYKIEPINHCSYVTWSYSNVCPFLNNENKCNIYPVRPEICKRFLCSKFKNNERAYDYSDKKVINMLSTFATKITFQPNAPDVEELDRIFQENKRKIKRF